MAERNKEWITHHSMLGTLLLKGGIGYEHRYNHFSDEANPLVSENLKTNNPAYN